MSEEQQKKEEGYWSLKQELREFVEAQDKEKDSLEIGTPAKGGSIKIYYDATNPEEARKKLTNALALRQQAKKEMEKEEL